MVCYASWNIVKAYDHICWGFFPYGTEKDRFQEQMATVDKMVYIDNHILSFSERFLRWLFS